MKVLEGKVVSEGAKIYRIQTDCRSKGWSGSSQC